MKSWTHFIKEKGSKLKGHSFSFQGSTNKLVPKLSFLLVHTFLRFANEPLRTIPSLQISSIISGWKLDCKSQIPVLSVPYYLQPSNFIVESLKIKKKWSRFSSLLLHSFSWEFQQDITPPLHSIMLTNSGCNSFFSTYFFTQNSFLSKAPKPWLQVRPSFHLNCFKILILRKKFLRNTYISCSPWSCWGEYCSIY